MKKLVYILGVLVGIFATASAVKYGADYYTKSHESRATKLAHAMMPKHRK